MPLLLNIDTATEKASVCISLNGEVTGYKQNEQQREHASFIHAAIATVLKDTGYELKDMEAIAVTSGPGSYTGLRVGMATAKGFCYALSKPLIAINTLEVMASAALETIGGIEKNWLLCPMIDARRMEVFTAMYDTNLKVILSPAPVILDENCFKNYMTDRKVVFFGSGSSKFRFVENNTNSLFLEIDHNVGHLGKLADNAYKQKKFSDISYAEPEYFKAFHSLAKA